mgnify:CR=1 FL=1
MRCCCCRLTAGGIPLHETRLVNLVEWAQRRRARQNPGYEGAALKVISWNLLRRTGATVHDVAALIKRENPDILLMQEATVEIAALSLLVGGNYSRAPLPGRIHGLARWSSQPFSPFGRAHV